MLPIFLALWAIHLHAGNGGIHVSQIDQMDCEKLKEATFRKTESDSFLLTGGESLKMDCGVCKHCPEMAQECTTRRDFQSWTIQRSRYLGLGGEMGGEITDVRFDLPEIRLRLHERLWPGAQYYPDEVDAMLRSDFSERVTPSTVENSSAEFTPPPLSPNLNLYMMLAREGEQAKVLRPSGLERTNSRIQLTADTVYIRQTRTEDTGVYYCYWNGKRLKEWAVTVVNALDEPFRQVTLPTKYDEFAMQQLEAEISAENHSTELLLKNGDGRPQSLDPQNLPEYNMRVFTDWLPWTDCVPCTAADQLPRSTEPGGDGIQMRVGICRVRVLDLFHSIRPHSLALQIDDTLRAYSDKGLPCRSHLIKDAVLLYGPQVLKFRPSEIQQRKCVYTCPQTAQNKRQTTYRYPTRVQLRVNEGEKLVIQCPIRGPVRGPISWFQSTFNDTEMVNLTHEAVSESIISEYGSPSRYLMTKLKPIGATEIMRKTRGRIRLDQAQNLVITEVMHKTRPTGTNYERLICVHGDPRSTREIGFSDWAGIIDIEVISRIFAVIVLSKVTQVVLLLIPFLLACGTFLIVVLTIRTERKPNMRAAAEGFTNKPPP
ncbi:hypothetical protein X801_09345 [Opisthorchis viverrini]|uniref:Ig-like domain-containing protein n=1 Tax=Opisthorchis viverrini TaxID=6198 RepID=A0A1S8WK85_OPIVI|nr:hypothetical protein X801_09345 [Opisthorchis viverrini]